MEDLAEEIAKRAYQKHGFHCYTEVFGELPYERTRPNGEKENADCRPEYFRKTEKFLYYGSKLGTFYGVPIKIKTPIIKMSKKEITELGVKLKAPLHLTYTCYVGEEVACGKCPSCLLRIKGFKEAGYIDPIKYRITIDWSGCKKIDYLREEYEDL
ncbi:MAG: 7-cyano-7-deazaguanine synthase [Candidatus Aenigmarchaeota archaeon]|nr:7-cyano-7-deazaguanine synthase [Candidatus Aenigmarchaeota archaeon]